ncbi:hypothetical protein N7528_002286 [Penicillium herquei]|nr:hypothetical protein N7528_002286 [Penicillium herquei]
MSGENTQSNLQDFSSHRRNPDLSKDPALLQQSELLTTPIDGLGITPFPMSVASESYFAGPMQPNSHQQYVWGNRPYQPLQPPSGHMSQQFPPPQSYPSSGYHVGYGSHPNALPAYHHDSPAPPSYLPAVHGASRQPHSRSAWPLRTSYYEFVSLPHQFSSINVAMILIHLLILMLRAPPYMINQPAYYLPEAPSIPSSHPSSMSSQTSSMVAESVFSPADSGHGSDDHPVRVVTSRPRPQCWDHGCNGREFSTFSNLLRHQREKSGVVAKAECPICGAVFTRTTARNIHVAQGKCKGAGREPSQE